MITVTYFTQFEDYSEQEKAMLFFINLGRQCNCELTIKRGLLIDANDPFMEQILIRMGWTKQAGTGMHVEPEPQQLEPQQPEPQPVVETPKSAAKRGRPKKLEPGEARQMAERLVARKISGKKLA